MNEIWSEAEENFIRDHAGHLSDIQLSIELTRITGRLISLAAIRKKRQRMKVLKKNGRGICALRDKQKYQGITLKITGGSDE